MLGCGGYQTVLGTKQLLVLHSYSPTLENILKTTPKEKISNSTNWGPRNSTAREALALHKDNPTDPATPAGVSPEHRSQSISSKTEGNFTK